jgi:hypothetical protein
MVLLLYYFTGQQSFVVSCDLTVSSDSTRVAESNAINGVSEITNNLATMSSDRPVKSGTWAESTTDLQCHVQSSAIQGDKQVEDDVIGSYGPEDAPSIITHESLISRPHTQTFLDKMQSLAFDAGYILCVVCSTLR